MKAAVLRGEQNFCIQDINKPAIDADEVLIEVILCGVCASELHSWKTGVSGDKEILGHEVVGKITQMGCDVVGFSLGERVTGFIFQGFAEYTKAHYKCLVKVPETLSDNEALGEPLACLVSGAERTPVAFGDTVAVVGLGYMGLGFMQLMRAKGAGKIIAVDLREDALGKAKELGAELCMKPNEVDEIYKVTEWGVNMDGGVDVAVEASGSQAGLDLASQMTGVHKYMSIVGFHQGSKRLVDVELWNWKAISVLNAHERRTEMYIKCMNSGMKLIEKGMLDMASMVTHTYTLDEINTAFESLANKPAGYIKAVVRVKE